MKHVLAFLICALAGCGGSSLLVPIPLPIPIVPVSASQVSLDGQWVIADSAGGRSCIVIQESRISILDTTCSSDGLGLVARIREAPLVSRAGNTINFSVSYNAKSGVEAVSRLTFVGTLQVDGTFVGTRRDEFLDPQTDEVRTIIRSAILSRS